MMHQIGLKSIEDLYDDIPVEFRLKKPLDLPASGLSEFEVRKHVETLLCTNKNSDSMPVFLGAGCWPHYVPAVVREIVQRSELLTAYTPYQAEIAQGILQALFEYQSMICELTGMEVSNCSMYDWASALGEVARMAARVKNRDQILVPKIIHPERLETLQTYAEPAGISVECVAYDRSTGQLDLEDLRRKVTEKTAAVYVENPSYLGMIEEKINEIEKEAHGYGALFVVGVYPSSLGVLKAPGDYGADIVIGEAQPLGNPMNFGGPLLGIMACRDDMSLIRQMPGRVIGLTSTVDGGRSGFCMALQTREQHIRREKATSNICSNEALCAVASAVYLALLGPQGMRELGETILQKANYAMQLLSKVNRVRTPLFRSSHFEEFTVNYDDAGLTVEEVNAKLLQRQIHGGKDISKEFPELGQTSLFCVTEIHSKEEIDRLAEALDAIFGW
jgi:glycine dehydrogenase subunit 1